MRRLEFSGGSIKKFRQEWLKEYEDLLDYELWTHLGLSQLETATIGEIMLLARLPRMRVVSALDHLREKDMVELIGGKPPRYRAISMKEFIHKRAELAMLEEMPMESASFIKRIVENKFLGFIAKNTYYGIKSSPRWMTRRSHRWIVTHKDLAIPLIAVLLLAGSFWSYKYTKYVGTAEFCSNVQCHSMLPYAQSYLISPHAESGVQCIECHAGSRTGPIDNKYMGELYTLVDYLPTMAIQRFRRKAPNASEKLPIVLSQRCLLCHSPISEENPATVKNHLEPIDVSKDFIRVLEEPWKYRCSECHIYTAHPQGGRTLPETNSEFYDYTHPGFPELPSDVWKSIHIPVLEKGMIKLNYTRLINRKMCKECHILEHEPRYQKDCKGCHPKDIERREFVYGA